MDIEFDAMTAGVKPGGLNSKHTIRVLLCYIINSVGKPITQQQLHRAIVATELANLFEFGDALSRLEQNKLIVKDQDDGYTVTDDGKLVAETLHTEVPLTVREQAYNAAINCLEYSNITEQVNIKIVKINDEEYQVNCKLLNATKEVLNFTMSVGEPELAEHIKDRLTNSGGLLYSCMLATLTGSSGLYSEAMKILSSK